MSLFANAELHVLSNVYVYLHYCIYMYLPDMVGSGRTRSGVRSGRWACAPAKHCRDTGSHCLTCQLGTDKVHVTVQSPGCNNHPLPGYCFRTRSNYKTLFYKVSVSIKIKFERKRQKKNLGKER